MINVNKLKDFSDQQEIANEYSDEKTCSLSDVGYHCSCYSESNCCCICGYNKEEILYIKGLKL